MVHAKGHLVQHPRRHLIFLLYTQVVSHHFCYSPLHPCIPCYSRVFPNSGVAAGGRRQKRSAPVVEFKLWSLESHSGTGQILPSGPYAGLNQSASSAHCFSAATIQTDPGYLPVQLVKQTHEVLSLHSGSHSVLTYRGQINL